MSYKDLKNALNSERELLIALNKMSPSQVEYLYFILHFVFLITFINIDHCNSSLIHESKAYGENLKREAQKIKEEETTKRKQIELEGKKIREVCFY